MSDEKDQALLVIPLIWLGRKIWLQFTLKVLTAVLRLVLGRNIKGVHMSEVNQVEASGKLGAGGSWELDVQSNGVCKATAKYSEGAIKSESYVEFDVVVIVEKLAADSSNKVDDTLVAMIKAALGRV